MKRFVHLDVSPYNELLRVEEAEPECGEDFCDRCGDCLHCYGGDPCYGIDAEGEHYWVVYEKPQPDADKQT